MPVPSLLRFLCCPGLRQPHARDAKGAELLAQPAIGDEISSIEALDPEKDDGIHRAQTPGIRTSVIHKRQRLMVTDGIMHPLFGPCAWAGEGKPESGSPRTNRARHLRGNDDWKMGLDGRFWWKRGRSWS